MSWLGFGKKGEKGQQSPKSEGKKKRYPRKTFILEEIITPSVMFPVLSHDSNPLQHLLDSLPHLHLGLMADGGACPVTPPTDADLPPLIQFNPFDPFGSIDPPTPTPGTDIKGLFETLPKGVIFPIDPPGNTPKDSDVDPSQFALTAQPLIGIIDTGFSGNNSDLDPSRVTLGRDRVSNDDNPLLSAGEGNEHGTFIEGIIGASRNNGVGIDGINDKAPMWVGRAIGSGKWADSLVEFVDAVKKSGQPNGLVNLSLDLTQQNPDGSVTTRYEFTPEERAAIEYARQNHVLIVAAAGNDGGVMSVLGQASQEFDNILTVGASDGNNRADYSSYGRGLDIMAFGGTTENPELSLTGDGVGTMAGTSVATAKVTGAASLVWAANPELNYRQVIEILKSTAKDLSAPGWDEETGAGLLDIQGAVEKAKVTTPEVYNPTPWVTPDTWSGEGKVTPEERAAQGGTSLATATVQTSPNFSERDRVDANQPEKYYQFTVNQPGYVSWNLTSLNPVSGFPSPPNVTIVKADGSSASHTFMKGASVNVSTVTQGQTSFQGGNFYDPGTYYLKVGNGAGATFKDYNISTQFTPDQVSSFTGSIQYRTQPYYSLEKSQQSSIFSGPTVSELKNVSGVVTYDEINFNNRIAKYGFEVKESGKYRINLSSPGGMELAINKFIGSNDVLEQVAGLKVSANSNQWLEVDLNKGLYDIEVKTPSDPWREPDWTWTDKTLVRPYTLNATFTPNAPQPGQGQVPSSAGAFDKTVVSNGVVNHYYANGYLTVQPSGQGTWFSYPFGVVSVTAQRINEPVPLTDPDGNYSIQTAANLFDTGLDLGDGVDRRRGLGSIGGNDLSDFYKFSLNSLKLVNFQLSQLTNGANLELIQDVNGNGQVDLGEVINAGGTSGSPLSFDRILGAGNYYLRVSPASSGATTKYQVDVAERSPENQVIAGYNSDYYLVQNAQLRWIPNQETLNALKINPNTVKRFSNEDLARIQSGNLLPSRKDGDVFSDFAGNIYLMQSEKRSLLPKGYTPKDIGINVTDWPTFPESDLKDIQPGDPYVPLNRWKASFINRNAGNVSQFNMDDFKNPVATLDLGSQGSGDGNITLKSNWDLNSPDNRVQRDYFAMQASTRTNMQAGKLYQVRTKSDDGTRFLLKNVKTGEVKTIKQLGGWSDGDWRGRGADEPNKIIYFKVPDSGDYDFYVQYYENEGGSTVDISMGEVKPVDGFINESDKTNWKSSVYWWDQTKGGDPPLDFQKAENKIGVYNLGQNDRSDRKKGISLDWRSKLPNNDVTLPKNNFAISSYTQARFEQGKKYTAWVYSDDGYQLYAINRSTGQRVNITPSNEWKKDAYGKHQPIDINVPPGDYDVYFNYFDGGGDAYFDLSWEGVQQQNNGGSNNNGGSLTPAPNFGGNTSPQAPQILSKFTESGTGKLINVTNFRSYPWADPNNSNFIQGISAGTTFTLLENVTTNDSTYPNWYKVRLNNGDVGYFWANNVEKLTSSSGGINQTPINNNQLGPIGVVTGNITPIGNSNDNTPVFPSISITSAYDANDGDNFVVAGSKVILSGKTNSQNIRFYLGDIPLTPSNINFDNDNFSATLIIPSSVSAGTYQVKAIVNSPTGDATSSGPLINVQETQKPLLVASNLPSIPGETIELAEPFDLTRLIVKGGSSYPFAIDQINYRDQSDGSRLLSFAVYNQSFADGVVEVRDRNNQIVEIRGVDGRRLVTGVIESYLTIIQRIFDPKFPMGDFRREETSKKTKIENIVIPAGGTLRFTQVSPEAIAYNLVTFVGGLILSPLGLPDDKITETLKVKLFTTFLEKKLESIVKPECFQDIFSFTSSLADGSWLKEESLEDLTRATFSVLAEEGLTQFLNYKTAEAASKQVSNWLLFGEMFNMYLNTITQWGNFYQAQTKEGQPLTFGTK